MGFGANSRDFGAFFAPFQRKSSKAKEKKQRRLEERAAMAAVCAKVEAANKLQDPLEAFPVFKKYDRNGLNVSIECRRVSDQFGSNPSHFGLNPDQFGLNPDQFGTQMKKVMLTVFKHNHGALQFFREALQ
ncbi:N-alpha-acetyltransferase 40 [Parus major]|uniref:N-alpha-acetyltransferase 40 n=1 Tax=Parus major TaxID=9157 RepID=UPI001443D38B|nr:N-alpha-acetyltransferase 40 [Parus major]